MGPHQALGGGGGVSSGLPPPPKEKGRCRKMRCRELHPCRAGHKGLGAAGIQAAVRLLRDLTAGVTLLPIQDARDEHARERDERGASSHPPAA